MKNLITIFLILFTSVILGQTTIAINSFEENATDTWTPLGLSTGACNNSGDVWDYSTLLSTITPNHLLQFWGIRDLNGNCGSAAGETLTFPEVNTNSFDNVVISFDYYIIGFDAGDDLFYEITLDGVAQGEVKLVDGTANFSTGGWLTFSFNVPNGTATAGLSIRVKQNGADDYAGIDRVRIEGDPNANCNITNAGLSNISCNDNGTTTAFTDDFITLDLNPTGANLGATYSVSVSSGSISPSAGIAYGAATSFSLNNGSASNGNLTLTITDVNDAACTFNVTVTDPGSCSNGYAIATGTVNPITYNVDCTTAAPGSVQFTSVGTFSAGNIYSAQLSDASGNFTSPTTIGTLTSTANSGTINFSIPASTPSGSAYRIRVVSNSPSVLGSDNGTDLTVTLTLTNCTQPYMTSLLSNSCSTTGCTEGSNELIFLNSGTGFTANTTDLTITYGNNSGLPYDFVFTDVLTPNAATISALNTAAGCPGLFVDGTNAAIPPNQTVIFAHSTLCEDALDWTGLCGLGPIYMIFNTDPSWNTVGGNFVNSTSSGFRYINIIVEDDLGNTTTTEYSFNSANNTGADGDFQNYSSAGGEATFYGNDGCMISNAILPINLLNFNVHNIDDINVLEWNTASENNNAYFSLERRTNNSNWQTLVTLSGAGNSTSELNYDFNDRSFESKINYYRLKQTDFNGDFTHSKIISTDNRNYNKEVIGIYNTIGQKVNKDFEGIKIVLFSDGSSKKVVGALPK